MDRCFNWEIDEWRWMDPYEDRQTVNEWNG